MAGIAYATGRTQGDWTEATLDGWVRAEAAQPTTRDGFDLVIVSGGGEPIRNAPGGGAVGRVQEGTLLSRVAVRGKWVHVRRTGWAPRATFGAPAASPPKQQEVAAAKPTPQPQAPPASAPPAAAANQRAPAPPPAPPPSTQPADTAHTALSGPAADGASQRVLLRQGTNLALAQDGERIATMDQKVEATVVEQSGQWSRVRFEGWVRNSDLAGDAREAPTITAAMIRQNPDRYVGQSIAWRVQFLAIQKADELRPEIPAGQSYLLTRGPLPETNFVYVMISPEQEARLKTLQPLDELLIEGVLRAGKTKYLPTPVVELKEVKGR